MHEKYLDELQSGHENFHDNADAASITLAPILHARIRRTSPAFVAFCGGSGNILWQVRVLVTRDREAAGFKPHRRHCVVSLSKTYKC